MALSADQLAAIRAQAYATVDGREFVFVDEIIKALGAPAGDRARCSDPIECGHEAALGKAEAEREQLLAELETARVQVARAEAHERLCTAERVQVRDAQAAARRAGTGANRVHREAAGLRREVEQLRAELERRDQAEAEALADQTLMKSLTVENGTLSLDLIPPREIAAVWVHCARGMLGDAPNYTETPVTYPSVSMEVGLAGEPERYALIVQRVGKLTPHEARQKAEAERDDLRVLLERLTDSVEHDLDSSACRERAAHQEQLSPCQQRPADHDEECPVCEALAVLHPKAVPGA